MYYFDSDFNFVSYFQKFGNFIKFISPMPPERIELSTPGLQDQCSATEL